MSAEVELRIRGSQHVICPPLPPSPVIPNRFQNKTSSGRTVDRNLHADGGAPVSHRRNLGLLTPRMLRLHCSSYRRYPPGHGRGCQWQGGWWWWWWSGM